MYNTLIENLRFLTCSKFPVIYNMVYKADLCRECHFAIKRNLVFYASVYSFSIPPCAVDTRLTSTQVLRPLKYNFFLLFPLICVVNDYVE